MIPGDIYIHKNTTGFGCDKIIQVMRMEIGAETAEVLTYSVADAGCTAETINISDVIYDRAWFLIYGESLCDLLHKYYVDYEACKEMLEARAVTIRDLNARLKDANKSVDKMRTELQNSRREQEQVEKEVAELTKRLEEAERDLAGMKNKNKVLGTALENVGGDMSKQCNEVLAMLFQNLADNFRERG